jgi:hypothetical protein
VPKKLLGTKVTVRVELPVEPLEVVSQPIQVDL